MVTCNIFSMKPYPKDLEISDRFVSERSFLMWTCSEERDTKRS